MQLYLQRHGIAEDGRPGQPDSARALTSEGKKKLRGIFKLAREAAVEPSLIVTSPYRRAIETAELAAEALEYKGELVHSDALIPASRPEMAWDEVRTHKDQQQVMLIGHDPLFTQLTGYLLDCPTLQVDVKKGAIIRIGVDRFAARPRGILKWMLVGKLAK